MKLQSHPKPSKIRPLYRIFIGSHCHLCSMFEKAKSIVEFEQIGNYSTAVLIMDSVFPTALMDMFKKLEL